MPGSHLGNGVRQLHTFLVLGLNAMLQNADAGRLEPRNAKLLNFVPKSQDRLTDDGAVRIRAPTATYGALLTPASSSLNSRNKVLTVRF